jgi:hypothetical protein
VDNRVLEEVYSFEWASTKSSIPKEISVRALKVFTDVRKPSQLSPINTPTIVDMIFPMEGFTFASALDLNMGYYQTHLVTER